MELSCLAEKRKRDLMPRDLAPHLLPRGTEVWHRNSAVDKAKAGPLVLAEDLLRGQALLEPGGGRALGVGDRSTQVGLQLGLQSLDKSGTGGAGTTETGLRGRSYRSELKPQPQVRSHRRGRKATGVWGCGDMGTRE